MQSNSDTSFNGRKSGKAMERRTDKQFSVSSLANVPLDAAMMSTRRIGSGRTRFNRGSWKEEESHRAKLEEKERRERAETCGSLRGVGCVESGRFERREPPPRKLWSSFIERLSNSVEQLTNSVGRGRSDTGINEKKVKKIRKKSQENSASNSVPLYVPLFVASMASKQSNKSSRTSSKCGSVGNVGSSGNVGSVGSMESRNLVRREASTVTTATSHCQVEIPQLHHTNSGTSQWDDDATIIASNNIQNENLTSDESILSGSSKSFDQILCRDTAVVEAAIDSVDKEESMTKLMQSNSETSLRGKKSGKPMETNAKEQSATNLANIPLAAAMTSKRYSRVSSNREVKEKLEEREGRERMANCGSVGSIGSVGCIESGRLERREPPPQKLWSSFIDKLTNSVESLTNSAERSRSDTGINEKKVRKIRKKSQENSASNSVPLYMPLFVASMASKQSTGKIRTSSEGGSRASARSVGSEGSGKLERKEAPIIIPSTSSHIERPHSNSAPSQGSNGSSRTCNRFLSVDATDNLRADVGLVGPSGGGAVGTLGSTMRKTRSRGTLLSPYTTSFNSIYEEPEDCEDLSMSDFSSDVFSKDSSAFAATDVGIIKGGSMSGSLCGSFGEFLDGAVGGPVDDSLVDVPIWEPADEPVGGPVSDSFEGSPNGTLDR